MNIDIREYCKRFQGMMVHDLKNYDDTFAISFRNKYERIMRYEIQIDCNWRIEKGDILIGFKDLYITDEGERRKYVPENEFISRFEKRISSIKGLLFNNCKVLKVDVNDYMEIKIWFSNGYTLTTFRDSELKEENWIVVNYDTDEVYRVFENGE